jgi:hypothetical protein
VHIEAGAHSTRYMPADALTRPWGHLNSHAAHGRRTYPAAHTPARRPARRGRDSTARVGGGAGRASRIEAGTAQRVRVNPESLGGQRRQMHGV